MYGIGEIGLFNVSIRIFGTSCYIKYRASRYIFSITITLCFLDRFCGMVDVYNYIVRLVNILTFIYLYIFDHKNKQSLLSLSPHDHFQADVMSCSDGRGKIYMFACSMPNNFLLLSSYVHSTHHFIFSFFLLQFHKLIVKRRQVQKAHCFILHITQSLSVLKMIYSLGNVTDMQFSKLKSLLFRRYSSLFYVVHCFWLSLSAV